MISIGPMTEFFHNRFGKGEIEAFSDPKDYNQKYVDQAAAGCVATENGCDDTADSPFDPAKCLCTYKSNAQKYDRIRFKNNTTNGSFGDSKDKQSEIIISNINLGIGIVLMMSYVYSMT
jgi:hypothetical protein